MKIKDIVSIFCCAALAYACGTRTEASEADAAAHHKRASRSAPLTSTLDVEVKDGVKFALLVTNESAKRVEVLFPNARTHDFAVLDSAGREVWRWSTGRMFTSSLQTSMIDVDDTKAYENGWDAKGAHGRFTVVGTLASSNFPVEKRTEFRLP